MTTKGGSHESEKPTALPAKTATVDLGTLVDQLVKLGLDFAAEALPAILTRAGVSSQKVVARHRPQLPCFPGQNHDDRENFPLISELIE